MKFRSLPSIREVKSALSHSVLSQELTCYQNQVAHDTHLLSNSGVDDAWMAEGHRLAMIRNGGKFFKEDPRFRDRSDT